MGSLHLKLVVGCLSHKHLCITFSEYWFTTMIFFQLFPMPHWWTIALSKLWSPFRIVVLHLHWCQNWCTLQEMLHHCAADEWSLFVSSSPVSLAVSTMNLMTKWRGTELNLTRVKRYRNWWFIVFLQISSFTRHQASSDCHPQPEIIGDSYLVSGLYNHAGP